MKVTQEQLNAFQKEVHAGKWAEIRMGQAFCLKFHVEDDALFYTQNDGDALRIIWEQFTEICNDCSDAS